jgi:DNA-binding MarR family transcriptional regulator
MANAPPPRRSRVPATARSLGRVLDFIRLLWALDHGLTRMSKRMLRTIGVTGLQRFIVRWVGAFPGISAGELAAALHVHPSTLTGALRRLTSRGMLVRTVDPLDARRALFRLTRKGEEIDAVRSGTVEGEVRRALGAIADRDLEAASRVLEGIAGMLSDEAS